MGIALESFPFKATYRDPHIVVWQKNFWDTQLRRGDSYSAKWDYVRNNPVRAGLVTSADDWPFQGELNPLMWHD